MLSSAGCRDGGGDTDAGIPLTCEDAPVLGQAGRVTVESQTFSWRWQRGWSVGDAITVQVPDDLTGLVIAVVDGDAETGVSIVSSNGERLIDVDANDPDLEGLTPPFFHVPFPAGAVTFPISADSSLAPGCLSVVPAGLEDLTAGEGRLYFVARRRPPGGVIDVNAVVVGGADISAAEVSETFRVVNEVFAAAGSPTVGAVEQHALPWPSPFVATEGDDVNALRAAITTADESRLNVFFVQDFLEEGTLGFAAGIPGPNGIHGTASSGLVVSIDTHLDGDGATLLTDLMGETIAHEIGHQLGLFHSTEADGGNDALDDTPACGLDRDADSDGELSAEECAGIDGENLMFWVSGSVPQRQLSPTQVRVLSASPVAR